MERGQQRRAGESGWIKTRRHRRRRWPQSIGLDPARAGGHRAALEPAIATSGKDAEFGRSKMLVADRASRRFTRSSFRPRCSTRKADRGATSTAQIVRPDGTPIPRLYSAGELGSIYSYLYQGTGNIGECLAFGRISARNAVAEPPWDR